MMLKLTPCLYNGQTGQDVAEETDSIDVALKQASYYVRESDTFKFFVITNIDKVRDETLDN